jgi:hypothetical protein
MKTEKEIKDRIEEIKKKIELNKKYLKDPEITYGEAEDIDYDNYDLYLRLRMLEWVLS